MITGACIGTGIFESFFADTERTAEIKTRVDRIILSKEEKEFTIKSREMV